MTPHAKIYKDHFNYCEQDVVICELCPQIAADIHHIKYKSRGGKNEIENLIALCRDCHDRAHFKKKPYLTEPDLKEKHIRFLRIYKLIKEQ